MTNSIENKEMQFLGTLMFCKNEIQKLNESKRIVDKNLINMYEHNMEMVGLKILGYTSLNEAVSIENQIMQHNVIRNDRNNYYAYFKKVLKFWDSYDGDVLKTLNEAMYIDIVPGVSDQSQLDSYKDEIKRILFDLSSINDFETITNPIAIKTKILTGKSLLVNGFDVVKNLALVSEVCNFVKRPKDNLIGLCYNRSLNSLIFVFDQVTIVAYDITNDTFGLYNNIHQPLEFPQGYKMTTANYLRGIKIASGYNNIIELYRNIKSLDLKFTDNLYFDNSFNKYAKKKSEELSSLIKIKF